MISGYAAVVMTFLLPVAAMAQTASGRQPPAPNSREEVIVTQSASGQELRGHIVELSPITLAILVDGKRVEVPLENVVRIDGRNDSLKNGAIVGASIMAGLSALGCAAYHSNAACATSTIMNVGVGALVGAGIDALHKGRTTIYSKPQAVSLAVAPEGKGARLQFTLTF